MKKNIFVDCSYLKEHSELNTGIQRVVRRVIENFQAISKEEDFRVIPINISNRKFQKVDIKSLYEQQKDYVDIDRIEKKRIYFLKIYIKNLYKAFRDLLSAFIPNKKFNSFLYATKDNFGLRYLIELFLIKPIKYIINFKNDREHEEDTAFASVQKGDILILLDSTWYMNIWPTVDMVKKRGVTVIAVIYDLIPITHPQFCDDFLVEVFKKWFFNSLKYVDGYIAISNTVKKDLRNFLIDEFGEKTKDKKFDYFLLGSDFNHNKKTISSVRDELKSIFMDRGTYLMVSTVEPRKNHKYLLDVFDKLWNNGVDVNLCIVGRIGWKVEDTVNRIKGHKLLNKKLFLWSDLNDDELLYCYEKSKMLLFSSVVEGFGLPIVESLTNALPVLASDIPIHREIGGEHIGYFNLDNTDNLVSKIIQIEKDRIPNRFLVKEGYRWYSWLESAEMLLDKVLYLSQK